MFLTRLGFGSRCVVTGDTSQIDLPRGQQSGLIDAEHVLAKVKGIAMTRFTSADVVRHPLVARIVEAYEGSMSKPELSLSLQFADPRHRALLPRHKVQRFIRAALELPGEIAVRIVSAEEGRALNLEYRGKDYATNVLTFDYTRAPVVAADLVLCGPVVAREAIEQGKTLQAHYAHLLVHGTLHAQGHDHEDDGPLAEAMAAYFRRIGGWMTRADLAAHRTEWVEPLVSNYRGVDVHQLGPNTQGLSTLQILNVC
eukprot:gene6082-7566_t